MKRPNRNDGKYKYTNPSILEENINFVMEYDTDGERTNIEELLNDLEEYCNELVKQNVKLDEALNKACDRLFQINSANNFPNIDINCFEQRKFNAVEWKEWSLKNE